MNATRDIKVYWGNNNRSFSVTLYCNVGYILYLLYFQLEELKAREFLLPQEY